MNGDKMTLRFSSFVLAASLSATLAHASFLTFSDLATFQAAAGPTSTTDFEGLAPSGSTTYYGFGLSIGGVNITTSDGHLFALSSTFVCQGVAGACNLGTGDMVEGTFWTQGGGGGTTSFAIGANIFAFGLNFRAYDQQPGLPTNANGTFDVTVDGGAPFSITSSSISNFIGIVSTTPLTSVAFTPTGGIPNPANFGEFFHFDNMAVGASVATPEPGTIAMISAGLIGIGYLRRKR
jgi:PEP-CTERM motif